MHGSIQALPFWNDIKNYSLPSFRRDLIAAFSVALMALPQAMAYAFVADLPTSAGIWSVIFGTIFTASFGQSRFLVSGPTNVIAIMIQSGTSEILYTHYKDVIGPEREFLILNIVMQLCLIIGFFQLLAALLKMGRLTQFISRSVILGYTAGAALAIIITQLFPFFGIREPDVYLPLYQQGWYLLGNLTELHFFTAFIGIGSLIGLILIYRLSEKIPGAVIVFVLAALLVKLFPVLLGGENVKLLQEMGPVYTEFPSFTLPDFDLRILPQLIPLAFAITLLTVVEATTIGKAFSRGNEPPYNENQEIYGLGVSNLLSSFIGAMPSSGSFSRSALNFALKAKTRFAAVFSGIFAFILAISMGFFIKQIPIAAISALLIVTAFTMINFKNFSICLKATHHDAIVVAATLVSSLIFALDAALYIGVILSIVLYLKQTSAPKMVEYGFNNLGKLRPLDIEDERPDPSICILQPEGELFFGTADLLQNKLREIGEDDKIKVIILQLLNTRYIDASVCLALHRMIQYHKLNKNNLLISGISREVWETLEEAGIIAELGEEYCFKANEQLPSEPTRSAYALAKSL